MGKKLPLLLLAFSSSFLSAQVTDTLAVNRSVDSLIQLSRALITSQKFDQALEISMAAKSLTLEKLGPESTAYGNCCINHGRVFFFKADYPEAEKWFLESKKVREKIVGTAHIDYGRSLYTLGMLYGTIGDQDKAEPYFSDYFKIVEKSLGKDAREYGIALNGLAVTCFQMGEYDKAEQLYLEAYKVAEKTKGRDTWEFGRSAYNLSGLYVETGNLAKAELYNLEAIDAFAKSVGTEHSDYGRAVNGLGANYDKIGRYEKAEKYYLEALAVQEKSVGTENPEYALVLDNLGHLYIETRQMEKAESCFVKAVEITEKALGENTPLAIKYKSSLAYLYSQTGAHQKSESMLHEIISVTEKSLGKEHPDYALYLQDLAELYRNIGDYNKALPLFTESLTIKGNLFGKEHPEYVQILFELATIQFATGNLQESSAYFIESNQRSRDLIQKTASFASESEMIAYLHRFESLNANLQSFTQLHPSPALCQENYENALFMTGLTMENNRILARAIIGADSATIEIYKKWRGCHQRLAKRYARPIAERKKIAEVEAEAEDYEKILIRSLAAFRDTKKPYHWQDIQHHLRTGEAAIEFTRYKFYNPTETDSIMYAALLLRPGDESPLFIPLLEERQLVQILASSKGETGLSSLYSSRGVKPVNNHSTEGLYNLIWQPLEKALSNTKTVYYAPCGLLHRLNFDAIYANKKNNVLSNRFLLVRLGSTRSLAASELEENPAYLGKEAILFGGIQYEMDSIAIIAANERLQSGEIASRGLEYVDNGDSTQLGESWAYLKGTETEVNALALLLDTAGYQTSVRKGYDATEEAFKRIGAYGPSPRVLHIATHGFFFPNPKEEKQNPAKYEKETGFKTSNNPLTRSGLILAGANYAWSRSSGGKPIKKNLENGILTAFEISHMNLLNTELVVLSACETGLGDIEGNEGVYGLQRAFKIAGAKYLVMSLWQVPDLETSVFMTTFYQYWLKLGMRIPDAFHKAQHEMKERFVNPYLWAGFVLME